MTDNHFATKLIDNPAALTQRRRKKPVTNPTWSIYHSIYCVSGPVLIGCKPGNLGSDIGGLKLDVLFITLTVKHGGWPGRERGGRVGVVMLGRSPYLHKSDWCEWGIAPVMVQLHEFDGICLKDGGGECWLGGWSDSCSNAAKQMMLLSWPCSGGGKKNHLSCYF